MADENNMLPELWNLDVIRQMQKVRHLARKKKGLVSKIAIDEHHFISISMHFEPKHWFVWYVCDEMDEDIYPSVHHTLIDAKKTAFELSRLKCGICYDDDGVRRRN